MGKRGGYPGGMPNFGGMNLNSLMSHKRGNLCCFFFCCKKV